jgi:hypothetical protein
MSTQRAALALSALFCLTFPAAAADHVVSPEAVTALLEAASTERAQQLQVLDSWLARPEVGRAAALVGHDGAELRRALPALSDAELRDLAERAQALRADPVAGLSSDVNQLLIIFLIVAIVVLVLQAVN